MQLIKNLRIYFDAACHNIPGQLNPMGIGLRVIADGKDIHNIDFNAGAGTSNIGEWTGCLAALYMIKRLSVQPIGSIIVYSDSQLIVNQYSGEWLCKHDNLRPFLKKALELKGQIPIHNLIWIKRDMNAEADKLSKAGLERNNIVYPGQLQEFINNI